MSSALRASGSSPTEQQFDVVIVGAGFGGIGAAIQLNRLGYDNLVILERENDLGGTWHVNRYPGLAVDIPSTTYSYWFEPNPNWSRLFAPGQELKNYADHVADKYDVRRHMRFNTTVEGARWDEDAQVWKVALADGETLTGRFLITATGFLSQPHTPDIPGITGFKGRIIHTTAWDDGYDFDGHRVAVIGTGATAVQLIPELSKKAADLTVYQRTAIHVVPKFDFPIPPFLRRLFARVPLVQRGFRWVTDTILELMMVSAVLRYHRFHRLNIAAADLAKTHRFLSVRDKELRRPADPGLRLRLQAADILELLLSRVHQAARPPADHRHRTDRAGRHRRQRRHQDRHRHPRAGHRLRPVGRQLSRHRDHRPRGS